MRTVADPILGTLEFGDDEVAFCRVEVGGHAIEAQVCFEKGNDEHFDAAALARASALFGSPDLDRRAREALAEDLAAGDPDGSVVLYLSLHGEELPATSTEALAALKPVAAVVYPANEKAMMVLDYGIGLDVSDYVVAVVFGADGEVRDLLLES